MSDPSTTSRSRAWVEVRLDRLRDNALAAARAAGGAGRLLPMVKANAYGLGVGPVVGALSSLDEGPPWGLGVAAVAEGEELRALGWQGRVIAFSPAPPGELARAAAADLTLGVSDPAALRRWAHLAEERGHPLAFHVEIDTGMGRAGLSWRDAAAWGPEIGRIAAGRLRWEGCYTHFHSADEPDLLPTDEQWARFQRALSLLPAPRDVPWVLHGANSAATLRRGGYGADLVRPGIFLYGGAAGPGAEPLPVAAVRARVALAREVPPGTTVGYGATYRATRRERWGTLSIGYGDGLPRALAAGGGEALVRGRRVPIIGRISMDVTTVDLTALDEVEPGDVATLIGRDGGEEITLDEVAGRCGTISYEILTGLTARLPRVYLDGEAAGG